MSELLSVEQPFLKQLDNLGWDVIQHAEGIPTDPAVSKRNSFREVYLKKEFKDSVRRINTTENDEEWLTDSQLEELFQELTDHGRKSLIEANQDAQELILEGTSVDENKRTGERSPKVQFVDIDNPGNNSFTAVNQFRIDTPATQQQFIIPDIVLFINGLPVVVIECKNPSSVGSNPMETALDQLFKYSNRRKLRNRSSLNEGAENLFHTNMFMVASHGDEARVGTISSLEKHFLEWKSIYPKRFQDFIPPTGKIRSQEKLIQGMLPPEILLDIIRHFCLFMENDKGKLIKIVARYQQYRAAVKACERLRSGKTWKDRSGVVWHTQGSGKSLTMVFIIRRMRSIDALKKYKILLINDRTDLEEQLNETAQLTNEKVKVVESSDQLKEDLASDTSNLVMAMMQKFQERTPDLPDSYRKALDNNNLAADDLLKQYKAFDTINESENILVMVDEAHRTQSSLLGANLFKAFPNATKMAFTGTPLITDRHDKRTHDIFGRYLDTYKLHDAVSDGATKPIKYEGKTSEVALNDKESFDKKFIDLFRDYDEETIKAIKKKYGTTGDIFEAEERIQAIADDLANHYIDKILDEGFKAQVVTNSKKAAVTYQRCIQEALKKRLNREKNKPAEEQDSERIKKISFLKTAVVISSDHNDPAEMIRAYKHAKRVNAVQNFKKSFSFDSTGQARHTGIAFLIVCDRLLTGFDAPIEQVMYIDKKMKEHNLLQAIARVNRIAEGKNYGLIVDYVGLGNHLQEALQIYSADEEDTTDAMESLESEIPIMQDRYIRLLQFFQGMGVGDIQKYVERKIEDPEHQLQVFETAVQQLEDIQNRAKFDVYFKKFLKSVNMIMPNKAGLKYYPMLKAFGHIHRETRDRYKDDTINLMGVGAKVKNLIDDHLISLGVNPKVPPVDLLASDFQQRIDGHKTARAKASEMEHAIRKHCKINFEEDPALYERFSEKLDHIIQKYGHDADERYKLFSELMGQIKAGRSKTDSGLNAEHMPFYDLLVSRSFHKKEPTNNEKEQLKNLTRNIYRHIENTIRLVDFWNKTNEQKRLSGDLTELLISSGLTPVIENEEKIVADTMELAKNRHNKIVTS